MIDNMKAVASTCLDGIEPRDIKTPGFVFCRCPLCDENKKVTFDDARISNWICWDCKKAFKEMKKYLNSHKKHDH